MEQIQENIPSAIYLRVSPTTKIKTEGELQDSLMESLRVCLRDIEHEGNIPVAIYIDEYVSGKSSKSMPGFTRMLNDIRNNTNNSLDEHMHYIGSPNKAPWKRMYARRVNRFGRNRADMIMAEIEMSAKGITLKFTESGVDTSKPYGKSVMAFMAEQAEEDRKDIIANTKRGRELAMATHTKSGNPFGHPKKVIDTTTLNMIRRERLVLPVKDRQTWKHLSETQHISIPVMIERLKEAGYWDEERRCVK